MPSDHEVYPPVRDSPNYLLRGKCGVAEALRENPKFCPKCGGRLQ